MIHDSRQIGIRERNPAVGRIPENITWTGRVAFSKEKARLGAEVRMTPPVQNNSRNVAVRIES